MIRLGPVTIGWASEVGALELVHKTAERLHQVVWFAQDPARAWPVVMAADADLAEALSHLPDAL